MNLPDGWRCRQSGNGDGRGVAGDRHIGTNDGAHSGCHLILNFLEPRDCFKDQIHVGDVGVGRGGFKTRSIFFAALATFDFSRRSLDAIGDGYTRLQTACSASIEKHRNRPALHNRRCRPPSARHRQLPPLELIRRNVSADLHSIGIIKPGIRF